MGRGDAAESIYLDPVNATIANALGLQHDLIVMSPSGRPFKFADKGAPVADVFA